MTLRRTKTTARAPPSAIDLFSGCGGLSVGLELAGFRVRAAVEIDIKAQETYRANHPNVRLYCESIRELSAAKVLRDTGLAPGDLDLLAGCPPCQGFSRLRTRNRSVTVPDVRNDLIRDFLRFVRVMRPKTVMLENVPGLRQDHRFANLCSALEAMEYRVVSADLDAADYSVAQRRKRLILLASRIHEPRLAVKAKLRLTVRDVIADLDEPSGTLDQLHAVPENRSSAVMSLIRLIPLDGGSRSQLPQKMQLGCHTRNDGFYDVYGRMSWDDVAPTITSGCSNPSKGRFLHPSKHRTITLREAALLQGFPADYLFDITHGKESIALMIGNALPPPFVSAHARELRRGIQIYGTDDPLSSSRLRR